MTDEIVALSGVRKDFGEGEARHTVLDGIDLTIERGEIFAVIGPSGAGKSTLVRLINGLEQVTDGTVTVDGTDITGLTGKPLRAVRSRIGMVFQRFNLFTSRTVFGNIAYPLQLAGWSKTDQEQRVAELLDFVGLLDKAWDYPEQLSGGQQQRIGIARALAARPHLLLADESTSALDPGTTRDVLALLRRVNEELGLSVIAITHEMDVVRSIADRVAVLDHGHITRLGPVADVLDAQGSSSRELDLRPYDDRVVVLSQHGSASHDSPGVGALVSRVIREHGVDIEIVDGGFTTLKRDTIGRFTLTLNGPDDAVERAIDDLTAHGAQRVDGSAA